MDQNVVVVPPTSTLFKPIQTQVYYCEEDDKQLEETDLKYLRGKSKKVADQKGLIVKISWHNI